MELALRGMGTMSTGGVSFTDTGGGITPENFQASCCTSFLGLFNTYPHANSGDACDEFQQANASLFGNESICSSASIANLTAPAPVGSVATVVPPVSSGLTVYVPNLVCPAAVSPCPCNGRAVVTDQDQADLLTCQALAQSATQAKAVQAAANANAQAQCTAQKVTCTQNYLMTAVSSDCSSCAMDFTNPLTWALLASVIIGGMLLAKSL